MYEDFINRILRHKNYNKVKQELELPELGTLQSMEIAPGMSIITETEHRDYTEKELDNAELWGEICWHITNGPGYCEAAPPKVKKYLRQLGVKC